MRNENWHALDGKEKGDTIKVVLQGLRWDNETPDQLIDGTIVKVTSATRTFTVPGARSDGDVRLSSRQYNARENRGVAKIGEKQFQFRIATPRDVERLTDPNRALREALDEALRDLRHYRVPITREDLAGLLTELRTATEAALELDAALANVAG